MLSSRPFPLLRQALVADAVLSGAAGLLMLLGAGFLGGQLHLPEALLRYAGLALVPYAAFVANVATRQPIPQAAVWAVIVANDLWAGASVALLLTGWVSPNGLGIGFVLIQSLVVAALSAVQFVAVRRSAAAA